MSSGGGGSPNVQNYDPSEKAAEMDIKKTQLHNDVTQRAYQAADEANYMRDLNVKLLRDGLGFMDNVMKSEIRGQLVQADQAQLKNTNDITNWITDMEGSTLKNSDALKNMVQGMMEKKSRGSDASGFISRMLSPGKLPEKVGQKGRQKFRTEDMPYYQEYVSKGKTAPFGGM